MTAAIHLLTENVQSLSEAAKEFKPLRAGRPVHPTALWRWSKYGVNTPAGRIALETVYVAGRVVTSREAVQRFLRRVAEAKAGTPAKALMTSVSDRTVSPAHLTAKTKLDAIGIKARSQ